MINADVSIQHVGARVYVQTLKDIWKYLSIIKTSLNLELKQVCLPSDNYLFFMKIVFSTLLQDHRRVLYSNFMKILIILDVNLGSHGSAS